MSGPEQIGSLPTTFIDGLGIGLLVFDAHSERILYVNDWLAQALQYRASELLTGAHIFSDLLHADERTTLFASTADLLKGVIKRSRSEVRYRAKDGQVRRLRTTQTAIRNHRTGKFDWISCALDEQIDAEFGTERRRNAFDSVTMWKWMLGSKLDGKSSRYDVLLGGRRTVHEPSIAKLTEGLHPEDIELVKSMLKRALKGAPSIHEYRKIDADGRVSWMRELVSPVKDASGEMTNLVGITVDISAEKRKNPARQSRGIMAFVRYVEAHWDQPLIISDLAAQQKVSLRSLHKYFSTLGTTPLNFLKRIRLTHAHDMLSNPTKTTTVTKVCARCGFGNLGHFAKYYRSEFGELPSETLARSQAAQSGITPRSGVDS